jgi:16S rRNA (adenine1518-N6/adenine1519-N6)-dimethyltransferase
VGQRLGQHFLTSDKALERIAVAACPTTEPQVVEIGPGQGALTKYLLERAERAAAIEIDTQLVEELAQRFPALQLVNADVLDADLAQWGECVIAGNLPYYITSPIIDKILKLGRLCRRAVLLVQKEVAERLVATPGGRDYGYLTVAAQSRGRADYLFTVPRSAFRPPPKVDSAVVQLTPFAVPQSDEFLQFASRCFRQKRKTLRNNLTIAYPAIEIDPDASRRAEQLSVAELRLLYSRLIS